jgi:hypothetical protein
VYVVIGEPIPVKKNPQYTTREVNALHALYIEKLEQLYNTHKADFGSAQHPLHIVNSE